MEVRYRIGQKVKVAKDNDNENYNSFRKKILIITHIAKNLKEHQGYDNSMKGQALYSFKDIEGKEIDCSLYEYEIEEVV